MVEVFEKNRLIKQIPILVKKGKNAGRKAGLIIYRDGMPPYYFVQKSYKENQMWIKEKFMEYVNISQDIVRYLEKKSVKNVLFQFVGFEKKSFFVVIPLKEFLKGRVTNYDDLQYQVSWKGRDRLYSINDVFGLLRWF